MLHQNWFQDKRFEMFEEYAESQSFYDVETKNIYVVLAEYGQKGSTIIQEITPESYEYTPNFINYERYKFKELHQKYGFNNPTKTRDDLSEDEERNFVNECFDIYEHIGLVKSFDTPYTDKENYIGMKFSVVSRVKEIKDDENEGIALECLPMWNIRFENGDEISAYPEEICLAENENR